MARVQGPLMSMTASGKLANSLVFLNWKGAPTVRVWKRPYNPKSTAQTTQRTLFTNAVAGWHGATADDQASWNAYAESISTADRPISGFNAYVSAYINNGDTPPTP